VRDPDGEGLWWKLVNRNKRTIALDLKSPDDLEILRGLVVDADVLIENFRPGTRAPRSRSGRDCWQSARLIVTFVAGFGQTGPYRNRPGFTTIAESMSGLAAISGEPGGQPLLPAIALTDEVTGVVAAFATMVALHADEVVVAVVAVQERSQITLQVSKHLRGPPRVQAGNGSAPGFRTRCRVVRTNAVTGSGSACRRRAIPSPPGS
jgi:crotonobetainyl-CoA:carnitine CoA-transferase CaiB-like acyl-CoA transferase